MTKELWLNLPVKNLGKSKEFFTKLGFTINANSPGSPDDMAALMIGEKNIVVMLCGETRFKSFSGNDLNDTSKTTEVLISIDAESREEVDELARKATAAGGTVFAQPTEIQGWMYGCGFADLDGHRWNALYMDMSKMGQ
jgi:predicted lactoylglutathione lyase